MTVFKEENDLANRPVFDRHGYPMQMPDWTFLPVDDELIRCRQRVRVWLNYRAKLEST